MTWPLSQDFNEAVQNPATSFADPDLKAGTPATTPRGVPLPRSGNYADVYQFTGPGGKRWAVKCFTRPVAADLDARYAAIADHLARANLPFTVGFDFLRQGIRVKGKYYPVVKMPWVDGAPINQFVREQLNRASLLEAMLSMWVRLCRRLREAGMAHCDLQHGNVLLVPNGDRHVELKLVDYDGMFVPALSGRPTGEAGHAAYQHPGRAAHNVYTADLDRFPHLVVATALRGLLVGGDALWRKYDNGDNLLFGEKDFRDPARSRLMRELWDTGDPFTVGLLAHLVLACTKPLPQTPWLDQLMPEGRPPVLTPSQERQAAVTLGIPVAVAVPLQPPAPPPGHDLPVIRPAPPLGFDDTPRRRRRPAATSGGLIGLTVLGGLLLIGVLVGVGIVILGSKEKPADTAQADPPPPTARPPESGRSAGVPPAQHRPDEGLPAEEEAPPPGGRQAGGTPALRPAAAEGVRLARTIPLDEGVRRNVYAARFSADGSRVIAFPNASSMPVTTFDAATGERRAAFRGHGTSRPLAAPLPRGRVLTAGDEPVLLVWDEATGQAVARVPAADTSAERYALVTDPTGRYAAVSTPRGTHILDLDRGRGLMTVPRVGAALMNLVPVAFAPDGTGALTAAGNALTAHTLPDGEVRTATHADVGGPVRAVLGWSPARGLAVVYTSEERGRNGRVVVVRLDTGRAVHTVPVESDPHARLTPDGRHLVAAEGDRVRVWDTAAWAVVGEAAVPRVTFFDLDLSPDGRRAAATSAGQLHLFDLAGDRFAAKPTAVNPVAAVAAPAGVRPLKEVWNAPFDVDPERDPRWVRFAPDGTRLVAPVQQAAVTHTFDAATGTRLATRAEPAARLVAAFPLPGGKVLTYPADTPAARAWAADTGRDLESFAVPHDGRCQMLGLSPDGRLALLRRNPAAELAVLDTRSGRAVPLAAPAGPGVARLSPDGATVLATAGDKALLFAAADGRKTTEFDLPFPQCQSAALAPDRRTAVLLPAPTGDDPAPPLHVFDVGTGKLLRTIPGPFARAGTVQFSKDGRLFGAVRPVGPTGAYSFEVRDAATWQVVARAVEPAADAVAFDFSPDGGRVVVWSADSRLRAYDLPGDRFAAAPPPRPEPNRPARKPVPNKDALARATAFVRDTLKAEFDKKLPADRRRLADRLLRDADQTADPANRYALLREAEAIAVELSDVALAAKAIDGLDQEYEIDGPAEKMKAVEAVTAGTTQIAILRAAAEAALEMAEDAAEADEYDRAVTLAGLAAAALGKAGQPTQVREAEARQQQLKKLRDEYEPVRRSAAALKANPADPAAALAVGSYRAFVRRRWDDGLPLLAMGSDPTLRKLAEQDLRAATDTETTDVQRGDAWAEFAKGRPEAEREAALSRAKFWYVRALSAQRGGLDVEAAKAKLEFRHAGREYRPGLITEFLAGPQLKDRKKALVELTVDVATRDHQSLGTGMRVLWSGVLVPPGPGRYRLVAETPGAYEVWLHAKTDVQVVLTSRGGGKREAAVTFTGEKPVPIWVEYAVLPERGRMPAQTFALKWVRPGAKAAEVIPPGVFFHPRKEAEKLLAGEK